MGLGGGGAEGAGRGGRAGGGGLGYQSGLASSAYLIQTEHDLYTAAEWSELENTENAEPVSNYWCIMMARMGDAYGYAIALNAKNYTKQDTIAFAKTVQYDK